MRKLLTTLCLAACSFTATAQAPQPAVIDSFKALLTKAITPAEKIDALSYLSKVLMNVNPKEADIYGEKMIEEAELSRDRVLMVTALLTNGERYSYLAGRKDNLDKSIEYYQKALELARQNKMDFYMVKAYLHLSEVHRNIPATDKALSYCNQAYSYVGSLNNDSMVARVHLEYGYVYMQKNEKLLALRNFLSGLRIAEETKDNSLMRASYSRLSAFYASIEEYDKSIDFQVKAMNLIDQIKTGQSPYNKVQDLTRTGDLYAMKKDYTMAMKFYERSLNLADSLKFEPMKAMSYRSIVNNYLDSDQPQKALDYFNQHPQLKDFLYAVNFGHFVDQSYGYIYTRLGKYDSAKYYYNKVAPFFEKSVNSTNQYGYYYQLGMLYKKTHEYDKSIEYFTKAKILADQIGNLQQMSVSVEMLDSMYQRKGDYKQAIYYSNLNYQYKDSLNKLGKEKELTQIEAADEQQRMVRLEKEAADRKRARNNIQYLGITIGIAVLFIALVILGMFKVSATTIKMIGFFAFLMFFEFIFLIFKKNVYSITQGEPWKDLLFMIALAALLLPLHHWIEKRVIHYLTSHNRLTQAGKHLKTKLFRRKGVPLSNKIDS